MTKAADNSRKPSGDACGPSGASVDKARNTTAAALTKPAKLPLPDRYGDNPTTGEVLYEYIRASDKLRAAAILHIFDAWLQSEKRVTEKVAESLRTEGPDGRRNVSTAGDSAEAEKAAAHAQEMAAEFRREMMRYFGGVRFPIKFLKEIPCPLTGGGLAGADMIAPLATGRRFDELPPVAQSLWSLALQPCYNDFASKRAARKLKKKGRPSREKVLSPRDSLSDLWHWQLLKVAEREGLHNLAHVFTLRRSKDGKRLNDGLPYAVGSNDRDYLNAATIRKRAGRAQGRMARLEACCPDLPTLALKHAALIGRNFAKLADWDKRPENAAKMQAFMVLRNIKPEVFEALHDIMATKARDMAAMVRL